MKMDTDSRSSAQASRESGTGLPHSKSCRLSERASKYRKVLECGSPVPLLPGNHLPALLKAPETMRALEDTGKLIAVLLLMLGLLGGCESTDQGSAGVSGGAYYGTGFYDPWYYGGYYDGPDIIVTPPERPESPPRPSHPIATPPGPRPTPMPSIPRAMPRGR